MEKLLKQISKFAKDNGYEIIVMDVPDSENKDIEIIVIDAVKSIVYVGTEADYKASNDITAINKEDPFIWDGESSDTDN